MKVVVSKTIAEKDSSTVEDSKYLPALLKSSPSSNDDNLSLEVVRLYCDDLASEGFMRGTIVSPMQLHVEQRIDPINWGVIVGYNYTKPAEHKGPMMLLKVRWCNGSWQDCSEKQLVIVYVPFWKTKEQLTQHLMHPKGL